MKQETIDKAQMVDARYFGNIPILRSVAILGGQVESMFKNTTLVNVRDQAGDLLFGLVSLARNQGWDLGTLLDEATTKIETRRNSRHYYESHVTIEPVFDERLDLFRKVCAEYQFRVATLLMKQRKEDTAERSAEDSFCTGRSISYTDINDRMTRLVVALNEAGFKIWRYKIESTLMDSRYDDSLFKLNREGLPEKEREPRAPADGALEGRVDK